MIYGRIPNNLHAKIEILFAFFLARFELNERAVTSAADPLLRRVQRTNARGERSISPSAMTAQRDEHSLIATESDDERRCAPGPCVASAPQPHEGAFAGGSRWTSADGACIATGTAEEARCSRDAQTRRARGPEQTLGSPNVVSGISNAFCSETKRSLCETPSYFRKRPVLKAPPAFPTRRYGMLVFVCSGPCVASRAGARRHGTSHGAR